MRLVSLTFVYWFLTLIPAFSADESICNSYINQKVDVTEFEAVVAGFSSPAGRGEFETASQYEERKRKAYVGYTNQVHNILIETKPHEFVYNIDEGNFELKKFFDSFYGPVPLIVASHSSTTMYNSRSVIIKSNTLFNGSYEGKTALGVTVNVKRMTDTQWIIYDRPGEKLFREQRYRYGSAPHDNTIARFPMGVEDARKAKSNLRLAAVVRTKEPFFVKWEARAMAPPTISNPFDNLNRYNLLIADILCFIIIDGDGVPLTSFKPNPIE